MLGRAIHLCFFTVFTQSRYKFKVTRFLTLVLAVAVLLPSLPLPAGAQTTEADVYVAQGVIDVDEKRYAEAAGNFRRALEIEPDHVEALYYSGVVHMAQRQPQQAVPFLERARAKAPNDASVAYQLGLAHFAQQQYDRAQPLLEEVFRSTPTQDSLGYYVGFMRYRNKDYRAAVNAFRAGRSRDPEIQQLSRFYTGLALAVLGLPAQATAEVEQAMSLAPTSALTGPAERLRDTLVAQRQKERRFSAEVRVGFFYDSNMSVEPNPIKRHNEAKISSEPLVQILRHPKSQTTGELAGVRAEYVWYRDENFDATVGYSFFTTYNNDLPSFNVMDHLGSLGVIYKTAIAAMPAQFGMNYSFDALWLRQDRFVDRHTGAAIAALGWDDVNLTQGFFRVQDKDFVAGADKAEDRDGQNFMVGVLHLWRFAQDKHLIKIGFQQDWEYTDGRHYTYQGRRAQAGVLYTLPWWALRAKWDFDVHFRQYTSKHQLLPTTDTDRIARRDQEINNIVRLELPLPQNLTLSGEYQLTYNHSNLKVFDYTRNVVSLILSWNY